MLVKIHFLTSFWQGGLCGCPFFFSVNGKNTPYCNYILGRCPHRIPVLSSVEDLDVKVICDFKNCSIGDLRFNIFIYLIVPAWKTGGWGTPISMPFSINPKRIAIQTIVKRSPDRSMHRWHTQSTAECAGSRFQVLPGSAWLFSLPPGLGINWQWVQSVLYLPWQVFSRTFIIRYLHFCFIQPEI